MINKTQLPIIVLVFLFSFTSCSKEKESESLSSESNSSEIAYQSTYQPDYKNEHTTELVAVVLTSSSCGLCTLDDTKSSISQTIDQLHEKTESMGIGFLTIGIEINWIPENGIKHLNEIASFDEIITGNNWMNTGGLKYIFDEMPGTPMVPQFLLTKRTYEASVDSLGMISGLPSGVRSEEVLVRKLGVNGIQDWLNEGVPIPDL